MDFDLVGLIEAARGVFENFRSGLFLGLSGLLYLVIQILRGKAGFAVPFITDKFNSIKSAALKTWIILGLFAAVGGLTAVTTCVVSFNCILDGLLAGLTLGFGTLGIRETSKKTLESDGFKQLTDQIKQAVKKDGQPK